MTERSVVHATFCLERVYDASPERLYAAFATPEGKAQWFGGREDELDQQVREFDFRVGGRERLAGRWKKTGAMSSFDALYLEIIPNQRIIYTYGMHIDDRHISESLATLEISAEGAGARLKLTEQGAFLDGYDDAGSREHGTRHLLERLAEALARQPA